MISTLKELRSPLWRPIGRRVGRFVPWLAVACLVLCALVGPAAAEQMTRIAALPAPSVFSLRVVGDTLVAGANPAVYVSTAGGTAWQVSSAVAPGVQVVGAVLMRHGRLYAGTAGQGVFISHDLGASWQAFNQGLVGGILNSQLDISDFELKGDDLVASAEGRMEGLGDEAPAGSVLVYVLEGGPGSDALSGGSGNDVYRFFRGDGQDRITDSDSAAGNVDTIVLAGGVQPSQIQVSRSGDTATVRFELACPMRFQSELATAAGANRLDALEAQRLLAELDVQTGFYLPVEALAIGGDLARLAFSHVGLDWEKYVRTDPKLIRPAEVEHLIGDSSKARAELDWKPEVDFTGLVRMMVDADLERVAAAPNSADRLYTL